MRHHRLDSHPRKVAAAAAIDGERTRFTITGTPGLLLDCLPDGSRSWYVRFQVGAGRKARSERTRRLGSFVARDDDYLTLGQAKDRAQELRREAKMERRDPFKTAEGLTFRDLFGRWLKTHARAHKRSWQSDEARFNNHIEQRLGGLPVANLTRRHIINALDDITSHVSGITANRCQAVISAVLRWSLDEGLIDNAPAYGIRKRGQERQRSRVLTDRELRAFWAALGDKPTDRVVKLLLLLGQRRTEVAQAAGGELAPDVWRINAARTKNGIAHTVPLTPFSRALFGGGFSLERSMPSHRVRAVADKLRFNDFRLHDLRHCVATGMASLGVPMEIRQIVMNQVTGRRQSIGARYDQHDYATEKRRALTLWQDRLLEIVEGRPPSGARW